MKRCHSGEGCCCEKDLPEGFFGQNKTRRKVHDQLQRPAEDVNFHERRAVADQAMNQTHQCLPPKTVLLFIKKAWLCVLGLFPASTQGQWVSEVIFDSSDIPIVIIDTQNQAILDEPRTFGQDENH